MKLTTDFLKQLIREALDIADRPPEETNPYDKNTTFEEWAPDYKPGPQAFHPWSDEEMHNTLISFKYDTGIGDLHPEVAQAALYFHDGDEEKAIDFLSNHFSYDWRHKEEAFEYLRHALYSEPTTKLSLWAYGGVYGRRGGSAVALYIEDALKGLVGKLQELRPVAEPEASDFSDGYSSLEAGTEGAGGYMANSGA